MDYKWHGKFVVEIHGNGCRNGSGTSYLVREGSKNTISVTMLLSPVSVSRILCYSKSMRLKTT
ncbi:hypothetical protein [Pseudomonas phage PA1C]|nr:hypothetical protein [Pseudomonas phage PA1C]